MNHLQSEYVGTLTVLSLKQNSAVNWYRGVYCNEGVSYSKSDVSYCRVVVFACNGGLEITDGCRQFPSSGHAFFCRQLHVLLLGTLRECLCKSGPVDFA